MKALTLWQPWASLVAELAKWVETRSWQPPAVLIGQTIGIHAAKRPPKMMTLGEWHCSPRYKTDKWGPAEPRIWRSTTRAGDLFGSHESRLLPLGAVIATCTLVDVVPIVDFRTELTDTRVRIEQINETLWLRVPGERPAREITDQLPYGDFSPGRFAWLLDDIKPLAEPVPARGRQQLWEWTP